MAKQRTSSDEDLRSWRDGAYTYVVVGELGETALGYLAQTVAEQLRA